MKRWYVIPMVGPIVGPFWIRRRAERWRNVNMPDGLLGRGNPRGVKLLAREIRKPAES